MEASAPHASAPDAEPVVAVFREAVERAQRGTGALVTIVGSPGLGKTHALETLRGLAGALDVDACDEVRDPVIALAAGRVGAYFVDAPARGDLDRRRAVEALVRQLPAHPAVVVIALGPNDPLLAHAAFAERLEVRLASWSVERLVALLRERSATSDGARLVAIATRAAGNPRHACEILTFGKARSLLAVVDDFRLRPYRALGSLVTCAATAVVDLRIDDEILGLALFREARTGVAPLEAAGLVTDRTFVDELSRDTVARLMGRAVMRRIHDRIARALIDERVATDVARRYHRIARHFEQAGDAATAVGYDIAVGNDRLLYGAFADARAAYERALAIGVSDLAARAKLWRDLAMVRLALGDLALAREAAAASVEGYRGLGAEDEATGAELLAARMAAIGSPAELARDRVERIRERSDGAGARARYASALCLLAGDALKSGRATEARDLLAKIAPIEDDVAPSLMTTILSLRGIAALIGGTSAAAMQSANAAMEASLQVALANALPRDASNASYNRAQLYLASGDLRAAKARLGAAFDYAAQAGHAFETLHAYRGLADVALLENDVTRARALLSRAAFAEAAPFARVWRAWPAARLRALTGESEAYSTGEARELCGLARSLGDPFLVVDGCGALALVLDLEGERGEAAALAEESLGAMPHAVGDYDVVALVAPLGGPRTRARGRALLAALDATHDARVVQGCSALLEARALARDGEAAAADAWFRRARRAFEALGWAGMARFATPGDDAGSRGPRFSAVETLLTARERAVALRAAQGVANGDIADEFGISRSTVEKHMSAVMQKLGIRSRFQIRHALDGSEALRASPVDSGARP